MSEVKAAVTDTTLVTGFPSFTARRMLSKLLRVDADERVFMLVRHQDSGEAEEYSAGLSSDQKRRLTVLVGDVTSMDLGLSGKEHRILAEQLTCVHHMAARYHIGVSREAVERFNVGGTRGALELALECRQLRRFVFWSTVHVSGDREGVVMEDELEVGQAFRNSYEHSKYTAEKIARQMSRRVPTTILRPGIIVGDSLTGEIDRYDGPYQLISVLMNGPFDLQLPLPGRGDGPLHLVPVDFVVDAAYELARMRTTVSRTFHLVDPAPLSGRGVYQLMARHTERAAPRAAIPSPIAKTMLKLPLPWVGRMKGSPKTIMEGFNQQVYYNCRNTMEALRATDVWCPSIDQYADNLVRFIKQKRQQTRHGRENDVVDQLM